MCNKKVYIIAAKRTAIGKMFGSLSSFTPGELGAFVIKNILAETGVASHLIDEVIGGNVLNAGQGQGVIRQAAIKGGVPAEVPAYGINMVCGSGLKSVMTGYNDILLGDADLVLAGGTEVMSNAGFIFNGNLRQGVKMGNITAVDHMVNDGLTDVFHQYHMGITAENVAEKYGITREAQDNFAYNSQQKTNTAISNGLFKNEIVPIVIPNKNGDVVFDVDEYPNSKTTIEKLASLKPAFRENGSVTAGNSSGINDGASFVMVASEDAVSLYNLTPLVEIIAIGQAGIAPEIMGLGPVPAIDKVLAMSGSQLSDIEVFELNEAFAAQSLGVMKELCKKRNFAETVFKDSSSPIRDFVKLKDDKYNEKHNVTYE